MNKAIKLILIIAGIACGLGLVFGIVGFVFGGGKGFTVHLGDGKMTSEDSVNMVSGTVNLEEFDELELKVGSYDFDMVQGDEYKVEYYTRECSIPIITQNGKKLKLEQPTNAGLDFGLWLSNPQREYVILTVPAGEDVYELSGHISSGTSNFEDINLKGELTVSSGDTRIEGSKTGEDMFVKLSSGDLVVENCAFDGFTVKMSSGDTAFTDVTASAIDYEISSGDCEWERVSAPVIKGHMSSGELNGVEMQFDELDAEQNSGDLKLEVSGSAKDYRIDLDKSSGDVEIDGKEYDDDGIYNESGSKEIKVKVLSGDVNIEFAN